jgi:hypothetical protein
MKKSIWLSAALIFTHLAAFAQIKELTAPTDYYCSEVGPDGTSSYPSMKGKFISTYTFNRMLRRDFSLMTTNEEGLPAIGNYAVLKLSDNNSRIALNGSFYNPFIRKGNERPIKTILSLGLKAGIADNVTSLFAENSVNDDVGINVRFSIIGWKRSAYVYTAYDCATMDINRGLLTEAYDLEGRRTFIKRNALQLAIDNAQAEKDKLDDTATSIANTILCIEKEQMDTRADELPALKKRRDELMQKSLVLFDTISSKRMALRDSNFEPEEKRKELDKAYLQKLYDYESKYVRWKSVHIKWLDFFGDVNGTTYNILKRANPVDSQVVEEKFHLFKFGLTSNVFKSKPGSSLFKWGYISRLTVQISNSNNIKAKNKRDIENITAIDGTGYTRRVIEKLTAYEQEFKERFAFTINYQLSNFLNESRNRGISVYFSSAWKYDEFWKPFTEPKPYMNLGAGYFLTLLDKEKESAVINFELFMRFQDLLNADEAETQFYSRNEIGLKVGLPFRSIFLNQNKLQ